MWCFQEPVDQNLRLNVINVPGVYRWLFFFLLLLLLLSVRTCTQSAHGLQGPELKSLPSPLHSHLELQMCDKCFRCSCRRRHFAPPLLQESDSLGLRSTCMVRWSVCFEWCALCVIGFVIAHFKQFVLLPLMRWFVQRHQQHQQCLSVKTYIWKRCSHYYMLMAAQMKTKAPVWKIGWGK